MATCEGTISKLVYDDELSSQHLDAYIDALDRARMLFLAEERNVAVEDGKLVLSEIFSWYSEDFEPDVALTKARGKEAPPQSEDQPAPRSRESRSHAR